MRSPLAKIYVDHYLQSALLLRLAAADRPLRFTEVKEDGIENSLFMYHANKLIQRGAIVKSGDGFALTPNGARWVNSMNVDMSGANPTVKTLVQFVIRDDEGNILLSSRKGQLKELLNDYMLPGGLHKSGLTADENAKRILEWMFGDAPPKVQFLSVVENLSVYDDGFTYHSISHVYTVDMRDRKTPEDDERFEFTWMKISAVTSDNPVFAKSLFVPTFIEKLQDGTLLPLDVITSHYN